MFNLFAPKMTVREAVAVELRKMVLVLHRYQHRVTGMVVQSYSNPDPEFWSEIAL